MFEGWLDKLTGGAKGDEFDPTAERQKLAVMFRQTFESPEGQKVLEYLEREFFYTPDRAPVRLDKDGRVDPYGSLYNSGCREVIQHIHVLLNLKPIPKEAQHGGE